MCLILRRLISAREEEEREKTEPAKTRQALLPHDVQDEEQPEVTNLGEEPAEEQVNCPTGELKMKRC